MTNEYRRPSGRSLTLDIIERILSEANMPLSVREMIKLAGDTFSTKSRTPFNSVSRDLALDIKKNGEMSRFVRTRPGRFMLRFMLRGREAL